MKFHQLLKEFVSNDRGAIADLARKLELSPTYIGNLVNGQKDAPPLNRVRQIAEAINLNEKDTARLIQTAAEERMEGEELAVLRDSFRKPNKHEIQLLPTLDLARRIPIFPKWEDANRKITAEDVPIGLECVTATKPGEEHVYALRIADECMSPEFNPGDIIIVDEVGSPKDGQYVIAVDSKGKIPILRQFKDYGKTKVLHAFNPECKDIVLEDKRYTIVGKVIENVPKSKLYS